jgi:hypothetical protein
MWKWIRRGLGRVLNSIGTPGFIRASKCHARLGLPVEVRVEDLFTVVSVQNVRLLFHRLSGRFDGVVIENSDCQQSHDADAA